MQNECLSFLTSFRLLDGRRKIRERITERRKEKNAMLQSMIFSFSVKSSGPVLPVAYLYCYILQADRY